ncbi:glycoside hydrolase family 55 protein [Paenibacillus sp. ISL-20]|uniref:glycoside hydrolase family 55 protein n=1 Tax=Paenibacillus sp. ISL-20 TaxID=2819163 RepID=UPI001BEBBBAB|nr:glycoside hydrolase family 55 protein [Paenibacillus sp. ISL-20]MBT2759840.1 hypothetical protein [Paenibacillus sp. ISL-20]
MNNDRLFPNELRNQKSVEDLSVVVTKQENWIEQRKKEIINVVDFGAVGDGQTDCTQAFINAMNLANFNAQVYIPSGTYTIKDTIEIKAKSLYGDGPYINTETPGTLIKFVPTEFTDLKGAFRIDKGGDSVVIENLSVIGDVNYTTSKLVEDGFIDKTMFDQSRYEMFAPGCVAFDVTGKSKPIFRNVRTRRIKIGLLLDTDTGHVSSYDCSWSGLIGVYCKKNAWDYFFQGGGINGNFCGVLLGNTLYTGYYGGIGVNMQRVHMGFSPYGFYQCIDNLTHYNQAQNVGGLIGIMQSVRFESTGEAAIKLLPKSKTDNLKITGFGIGVNFNNNYALPGNLIPSAERQKYCAYFGSMFPEIDIRSGDAGGLFKAKLGSAYIYNLGGIGNNGTIEGLTPEYVVYENIGSNVNLNLSMSSLEQNVRAKITNPFGYGQIAANPEEEKSWVVQSGLSQWKLSDLSEVPPFSKEMVDLLGDKITVMKFGGGTAGTTYNVRLKPSGADPLTIDSNRAINFEFYVCSLGQTSFRSSLTLSGAPSMYDQTRSVVPGTWTRIVGRLRKPSSNKLTGINMGVRGEGVYIAGAQITYDDLGSYSPYPHIFTPSAIETKDGVILTDSITGTRYKITIVNGNLTTVIVS